MYKRFSILLLFIILGARFVQAQDTSKSISLSVDAGFDGTFRENSWIPLYIHISNDGAGLEGHLVVRPETSSNAVRDSYNIPISLPTGSQKTTFLYITAESFASEIRVEMITNEGVVAAVEPARIRSVQSRDQIHVVVTQSTSGALDLSTVHDGGYNAYQANWVVNNIPDREAALEAINTLVFSDIDSGTLSAGQQQAISDWVTQGGHLLVTGGVDWQSTASGLIDLLPMKPDNSRTLDNLTPLAKWLHFSGDQLIQQTVVATGTVQAGARVLASDENNTPLLIRRTFGAGTVDYLTASPSALPLRGWGGLGDMWLALASSVNPKPGWSYGVADWDQISSAVNILPGVNLLPDILPLVGFLALYIALIGPLNYIVLNRINRREYAWVTIPIFIVLFSALAWTFGFNLRGSEVTLSRMSIVQSWPDSDHANVEQIVGLLSPRRTQYSLSNSGDSFLRTIPRAIGQSAFFGGNIISSTTIEQAPVFRAVDFPVDASFIAGFESETTITKPDIGGDVTLITDGDNGQQIMRGSVRNNSDLTLSGAAVLVRGQSFRIENPIAPGDVIPFEFTLPGEGLPSPSPLAYTPGDYNTFNSRFYSYYNSTSKSIEDILGGQLSVLNNYYVYRKLDGTVEQQEFFRRTLFLSGLISEPYKQLTGRGNHAYLAGWTDKAPLDTTVESSTLRTIDTTLLLVQLDVKNTPPQNATVITADQFTWFAQSRSSLADVGPLDISFNPGDEAVLRFTPLPDAVLKQVNELRVYIDRKQNTSRSVTLQLWNWDASEWEDQVTGSGNQIIISNPARYIGPENAVQVRVSADAFGGYPRLNDLSIEQMGLFE
ncbi:MAG: hypothetical protein GC179_04550 [Anaerolineaceae bacterium]|nr:hypothetical protein [Anaerolineaceae bacterium]